MNILNKIEEHIKYSINTDSIELEYIYGKNNKQNVNKETFVHLLKYYKEYLFSYIVMT